MVPLFDNTKDPVVKPIIRRMTSADMDAVIGIERRVFAQPWSRKSFRYEISNRRYSSPLVLEWRGQVIGYAVVWNVFEELHIANLAIHPSYQRQGWGQYLLGELLARAQDKKCAILEVRESNLPAIRLYQKFGFKRVALRPHYYPNGENAVVMKKHLGRRP